MARRRVEGQVEREHVRLAEEVVEGQVRRSPFLVGGQARAVVVDGAHPEGARLARHVAADPAHA